MPQLVHVRLNIYMRYAVDARLVESCVFNFLFPR